MGTNNQTDNYQSAAAVACNYNGVAQTIYNSANVSSVTYSNVGRYIVNFIGALSNANYITILTCGDGPSSSLEATAFIDTSVSDPTTTAVYVVCGGFDAYDFAYYSTAVFTV